MTDKGQREKKGEERKNLEDYEPGTTKAQVFKALKKVTKSKPSEKPT